MGPHHFLINPSSLTIAAIAKRSISFDQKDSHRKDCLLFRKIKKLDELTGEMPRRIFAWSTIICSALLLFAVTSYFTGVITIVYKEDVNESKADVVDQNDLIVKKKRDNAKLVASAIVLYQVWGSGPPRR